MSSPRWEPSIKISQHPQENTSVLALADLLLQDTYGGCVWIFEAVNTFLRLILEFAASSRTGFCSELLRVKPRVKPLTRVRPQKQPLELFCENLFLEILEISQENTCVEISS